MLAREIMTAEVFALTPGTSVLEAALLLVDRRIGGAPVLDESGRVVGIVSEGDLMRRAELGTERVWSGWREFFAGTNAIAHEFVRSHGTKVGDIMSAPVWTAHEDMPLAEIAELFEKHRIRRLPVVRDGKMVGIVSRADLVRTLLRNWSAAHPPIQMDDEAIRKSILEQAAAEPWGGTAMINVEVRDGAVELYGIAESEEVAKALAVLAESVPGVRTVRSHLKMRSIALTGYA